MKKIYLLILVFSSTFLYSQNLQPGFNNSQSEEEEYKAGEFILLLNEDAANLIDPEEVRQDRRIIGIQNIEALSNSFNITSIDYVFKQGFKFKDKAKDLGLDRYFLVKVPNDTDLDAVMRQFQDLPEVELVEYNYIARGLTVPNDPLYDDQWGLKNTGNAIQYNTGNLVGTPGSDINIEPAWDIHTGVSNPVTIAILDSGVDYNHPEFSGRMLPGYDFNNNNNDPMDEDYDGHGTACAGIAAAAGNNGIGLAGVNWGANILPVKVLDNNSGTDTTVANGMVFSIDQGADVLSMSLGGSSPSTLIENAVNYAYTNDVLVFAARGNDNNTADLYPSSYTNVISVGGLSPCDTRKTPNSCDGEFWWGASYGGGPDKMDFVAPATRIVTTDITGPGGYSPDEYTSTFNGTSSACPFAAGVGALIRSINPSLSVDDIRYIMRNTAVDIDAVGYDDETGYGRINAEAALLAAEAGFWFAIQDISELETCIDTDNASINFDFFRPPTAVSEDVSLSLTGLPSGLTGLLSPVLVTTEDSFSLDLSGISAMVPGGYNFTIQGVSASSSYDLPVTLNIYDSITQTVNLTFPANNQSSVEIPFAFEWSDVINANSYQIQIATDSGFTNIVEDSTTTNTEYLALNIEAGIEYYWRVRALNSCGGGSFSIPFSFITNMAYCDAGANNTGWEYIGSVFFNDIFNLSGDGGYEDFTDIYTLAKRGDTYFIEVETGDFGSYPSDEVLVWVDLNQDSDFDDPGELVVTIGPDFSPWSGNITIPIDAKLGETRMRIRLHDSDFGPNFSPCGNSDFGEVEDYTVVIYDDYVYYNNFWTPNNPVTGAIPSTNLDNIAVLNGTANINGQLIGNELMVDREATLEMDAPSTGPPADATILNLSGDISNDGNIAFKSNANGSAQLDEFSGTISGTGNVIVERYIPAKRAFRLLSSPVTTTDFIFENWQESGSTPAIPDYLGTHITGGVASLGFDQNDSGNPSMFTFDNANSNGTSVQTDDWIPLSNTNATKLRSGEAYLTMVRGDRSIDVTDNEADPEVTTLSSTGELFTGSLTYSPSNPTSYLNINTVDDFYNLIANPYQAVVDFNAVGKTGLTDFIYVWDAKINGANGRGGYVTVELPSGSATEGDPPSASSSDADQYLAPGMSFFVQNDSDGATTTSITFEEADKATGENQNEIFSSYSNFYINSRLYKTSNLQNGDTESDALGLRFNDDFTTPGTSEDATKLFNPGENYAIENNGLRSIDKQQIPTIGHQIDLNILNYQETNYSLTFEMDNKPAGLGVFLEDMYLNTIIEITNSFVYNFTVDTNIPESTAVDRFSLVFDNTTLGVEESSIGDGFVLYPNPTNDGNFTIKTPNLSGEVVVKLTNMLGQKIKNDTLIISGNEVIVNAKGLSKGVYIVVLSQDNNTFSSKLIVE